MNAIILAGLSALVFTNVQAHQSTDTKNLPMSTKSSAIPDRRTFPLSTKISACENFHDYVCDNVENSFELRPDRSSHTFSFSDSFERILNKKKEFFSNIENEKKLTPRAQQIKNFYLACMNESAGAKEEKDTVATRIKAIEKVKTIADFLKLDTQNFFEGKANLLVFDSSANADDPDKYDMYVAVSFMNLPDHGYYEKPELVADYKTLMTDFFKVVYPNLPAEEVKVRVEKMYNLETEFVNRYPKAAERRQRWGEKRDMPQKKFLADFPNIKAQPFLSKAPKNLNVRVNIPESFQFYNEYLTEKNLDTLKDIYLYRTTSHIMDDGYPDFFAKKFAFNKKHLGGPESRPVRQERCTLKMMSEFEKEVDEVLMARLFPNFPKQKVVEISEKIRTSILDGINKSTWLSAEAKETAKKKINSCRLQVVAPQNDREWNFNPIQKYSANEPLKNQQKLRVALIKKTIKEMYAPVNKDAWGMGPLTVNAYFSPSENKFVMPMGILQYPFFDDKNTLEENLGAVGAVMGHELGHGIDDQGSRFDDKGRLKVWMSMADLTEFQKRGERMVAQFEKAGHNGKLTLGENVADLVGLSFAYKAAFKDNKGTKEDKQKFFVSYARTWCEVKRDGYREKQLKTDPHALGWARINEQVKHQPGFQEAFDCKQGQPMVLSDKDRIVIW
ncbi:MAG: M13 family metallopeptidase [Bdellovibrionaceae bacterium]|nr:M13 family metallopeptidase [Pseudobdellovibrionaceae bacterium]